MSALNRSGTFASPPPAVYEIELRERMVRVEEELRNQRELIKTILVQMDKRFDAVDKRFDAVDKRFDAVDKRFDAVDKRFESMQQNMDKRFESMQQNMDKRFESMQQNMDNRFESMQQNIDKRFEASEKRFEALTRRLDRFMFWSFGLTVSVGALVVAAIKLWT